MRKFYKNLFLVRLFLFVVGSSYAQTPDCYYDADWQPTTREYAAYYRVFTKLKENYYKIEDFYADGTLKMLGYSNGKNCKYEKLINETTWYDREGRLSSYNKYDEQGEVIINKTINDNIEKTVFITNNRNRREMSVVNGSPFIDETEVNGNKYYTRLFYKEKLLYETYHNSLDRMINKKNYSYEKYYDFNGKLLYKKNDNKYYRKKTIIEYYDLGYIATTKNNYYQVLKQETYDSKNQLIATLKCKDGSPDNGIFSSINSTHNLVTEEYNNGKIINKTCYLKNNQKVITIDMLTCNYIWKFYDSVGNTLGILELDKNDKPFNGQIFNKGILLGVYNGGIMTEKYTYNIDFDIDFDVNRKENIFFSYDYFDAKNVLIVSKRVQNELQYFDVNGQIVSTLILKNRCNYDSINCKWENYTGKYYRKAKAFDYENYEEYLDGKLVKIIDEGKEWVNNDFVVDSNKENVELPQVYTIVEQMPEFPGGLQMLMKYLNENIIYPVVAVENNMMGKVTVSFIIDENGDITDERIIKSSGYSILDKEALRVVYRMPKWDPGRNDGKAVAVSYLLPITFKLENMGVQNKNKDCK